MPSTYLKSNINSREVATGNEINSKHFRGYFPQCCRIMQDKLPRLPMTRPLAALASHRLCEPKCVTFTHLLYPRGSFNLN